jgi:glycosyltransferase involved in cell wall biosynthesis
MNIAIWIQGGIGAGNFSQGYPPLLYFIMGLSKTFNVTVYSIFPANEDFRPENFTFRTVNRKFKNDKLRSFLLVLLFIKDHLSKNYSLIHAFWVYPAGTIAVFLGKLLRIPSIVTVQGGEAAAVQEINYGNMLKPWLRKLTLYSCEHATVLNTISKFLEHQLFKNGLKRTDAVVIPFGADTKRFTFTKREFSLPLQLIHVGNLTEVKDQETIIRAFKLLLEKLSAKLMIIGADYLNGKLQELTKQLNIEDFVNFLGPIPQYQLPQYYQKSHIMVHTSLHEGQSGVVMEAMAAGVVVCGTPVGIMFDLNTQCFQMVKFRDSEGLANAIVDLWTDKEKYFKLQKSSYDHAIHFNNEWTRERYSELYLKTSGKI